MISKICFNFSMTPCANHDVLLAHVLVYILCESLTHVDPPASDNDVECIIMFECSPSMQ